MRRISFTTKHRVSRATMYIGLATGVFCVFKSSNYIYDVPKAIFWFIAAMIVAAVSILAAAMQRYYKVRSTDPNWQQQIAVETLDVLAKQRKKDKIYNTPPLK